MHKANDIQEAITCLKRMSFVLWYPPPSSLSPASLIILITTLSLYVYLYLSLSISLSIYLSPSLYIYYSRHHPCPPSAAGCRGKG